MAVQKMPRQAGDQLKAYALAQLQRANVCLAWRGSRAHEGVHQARKSMRRVRACLALGESALGAGASMLDDELSKICESLSSLRDAQARVESLDRLLKKHPDQEIHACLNAAKRLAIAARAEAMRCEQAIDKDFLTRRERLQVVFAAMPVLPWQHIDAGTLALSMQHSIQACEEAAEIALSRGKEKDWHRLRRRRRRLIQQHTALENCHIELPSIAAPDRKLGTLLGEAQDISILRDFFRQHKAMSEENQKRLRKLLKHEFGHLSAEAMAGR
ncbi:MAG TPA: CHAD domain-containing protein [Arenimonas sp.]|nr:CHAD domain-containing protein [Arenimonas sp.]